MICNHASSILYHSLNTPLEIRGRYQYQQGLALSVYRVRVKINPHLTDTSPVRPCQNFISEFLLLTIMSSLAPLTRCAKSSARLICTTSQRGFHIHSRRKMAATLNSETISKITEKEKEITGRDGPVKGGPTAKAQSHVGQQIDSQTIRAINDGEQKITGGETLKAGPTAEAQSMSTGVRKASKALS